MSLSGVPAVTERVSIQPTISRNVRIMMAHKGVDQRAIGAVIGRSAGAVSHKLAGRAEWSADEIFDLSTYGGPKWPVERFYTDPDAPEATRRNLSPKLRSIQGEGRDAMPRSPLLTTV